MTEAVALIVGAGDATGGAIARRFARGGMTVCAVRRDADKLQPLLAEIRAAGGSAHGFGSDARREEQVVALVEQIEATIGPIEALVFNIGANVRTPVLEETARRYFKIWEMATFGAFLYGREVAKRMVTRRRGTVIFTGATASTRGQPVSRLSRAPRWPCAHWRKAWRASWGRRASMWRTPSSTVPSTPSSSAPCFRRPMR